MTMNAGNIVLLDGGMGQELVRRSNTGATPLWSTQVMINEPAVVHDLHVDYIRAGAKVITINAYSATPERLQSGGVGEQFETLQRRAIDLALRARDTAAEDGILIAGCLPPLVASYRPELAPDFNRILATYRKIVTQQANHVDCFLCETMASVKEARAVSIAAKESGKPVWVGLSVADDNLVQLRSGEPLEDALRALSDIGVEAVLLNCSLPESITASWTVLSTAGCPIGAYANGFTSIAALKPGGTVDSLECRTDLDPDAYAEFAMQWVKQGASIVGGCCEVGPEHIRTLAKRLNSADYTITGELV